MKTLRVIPAVLIVAVILGSVGCKNQSYTEIGKDEFEITESTIEIIPVETDVTTVDDSVHDADIMNIATRKTDVTVTPTPAQSEATVVIVETTTSVTTETTVSITTPAESAIQTETPIPSATPIPTVTPTPEPTATPIPTNTPTPTPIPAPTIEPVYDSQYTNCIADFGWEDNQTGTSGTVYNVPCRRNSAGVWIATDEGAQMVSDVAIAAGACGYSKWIIDGSQRDFS